MKQIILLTMVLLILGCKKKQETTLSSTVKASEKIALQHADGFTITTFKYYKTLTVTSPWVASKKKYTYALVPKQNRTKVTLKASDFDNIITTPVKSTVVTSTTHVAFLDVLDVENTLIGFPNTNYISSKQVRKRIDNGHIEDIGNSNALNTEVVLKLKPETIFAFSLNGVNKTLETLEKAKIPIIYVGEWTESSPLAKAEWLKVFGLFFNKEKQADSIFNTIESNYKKAQQIAALETEHQPSVFSGAMYKDIWYLPSGTSSEAILFKDAHTNYLWRDTKGQGSLELNFETVFSTAKTAEFWFNPFSMVTLEQLKTNNTHYTQFSAYRSKNVYSFANTKGATGGILYYELGTLRPDLVLKDIIKICHPSLLPKYRLFFYKQLQ